MSDRVEIERHTPHASYEADLGLTIVLRVKDSPAPVRILETRFLWDTGVTPDQDAATERAAEVRERYLKTDLRYDASNDAHLRIYGVPGIPRHLCGQYGAKNPPVDFDWSILDPTKSNDLEIRDIGDISTKYYGPVDAPFARRKFTFVYVKNPDTNATELSVAVLPGWARNDGSWVNGAPRDPKRLSKAAYNKWRGAARTRIFENQQIWIPLALVAIGEATDVPDGENISGAWFTANHAQAMSIYLSSGRKDLLIAGLTTDETPWLDTPIPPGTLPGQQAGDTIRKVLIDGFR